MSKQVGFIEANKLAFTQITDYKSKSGRSEFWWYFLGSIVISAIASCIPVVGAIVGIILFFAGLALMVRRLHDLSMSGWWVLIGLTGIGALVLLVLAAMPSK